MPSSALLMVLLAAVTHATWNLAAKRAADCRHFVWLYSCFATLFWLPAVLWIVFTTQPDYGMREWLAMCGTALLHLGYSLSLQHGYRVADLSVVYPVARGVGPVLSFLGAAVLLRESPTLLAGIGLIFVVLGIALQTNLLRSIDHLDSKGLLWGVITGTFVASYTLNDGYAVKILLINPLLLDYFGNLFRMVVLSPKAIADRARIASEARRYWRNALAVSVLGTTGYMLVLYAMKLAPISHVAPARELATLVGALFGAWFLKEKITIGRALGALCIVAGVMSLAFAS